MANLEQANATMYNFAAAAKRKAQAEIDLITQFAAGRGAEVPLQPWDVKYWLERYKREEFQVDEAALRDYLLVDNVLEGMFQVRYNDWYNILCHIRLSDVFVSHMELQSLLLLAKCSARGPHDVINKV
jgi:Zn-dependent oligopeptidase